MCGNAIRQIASYLINGVFFFLGNLLITKPVISWKKSYEKDWKDCDENPIGFLVILAIAGTALLFILFDKYAKVTKQSLFPTQIHETVKKILSIVEKVLCICFVDEIIFDLPVEKECWGMKDYGPGMNWLMFIYGILLMITSGLGGYGGVKANSCNKVSLGLSILLSTIFIIGIPCLVGIEYSNDYGGFLLKPFQDNIKENKMYFWIIPLTMTLGHIFALAVGVWGICANDRK